jgi:fructokinase
MILIKGVTQMEAYAGIETGGTKCVCMLARSPKEIYAYEKFPTEDPESTVVNIAKYIKDVARQKKINIISLGIASFGPIDLHQNSPTYGFVTSTPKPGWKDFDLLGHFSYEFAVPTAFDTDTNGAAFGEYYWGAGKGLDDFIYLTIGTGIGGGAFVTGRTLHGLIHPEMGHILIPHDREKDPFPGGCPFHGDCFEGLASGPALEKRWGMPAKELPQDHPAWKLEAHYIAAGLHNLICSLSPQRLILGGGVMNKPGLIEMVRSEVQESLRGYVQSAQIVRNIDTYIVSPALGDLAGVIGAIAMAREKQPLSE